MARDTHTPRAHLALLGLLTLLGLALRWTGIDYGLPHITNLDERVYLSQYRELTDRGSVHQARSSYSAYPAVWMHVAARVPRAERTAPAASVDDLLEDASADFVFLRRCVALLASLVIPGTWLLARRFVSSGWSLVAAALVGASVLDVCHATQARPHAIVTAAIVFAVALSIDVARDGTWRASVLAAIAAGASIAILQSGAAALLPFVVAHALRLRVDGARALARFALGGAVVAVIFLAAYPGILLERIGAQPGTESGPGFLTTHGVSLANFQGGGARAVLLAFWNHDPLLLVACAAGIVVSVARWAMRRNPYGDMRAELVVVLAFVAPFLAALCLFQNTYYRFALPLFPFAALFAVLGGSVLGRSGVVTSAIILLAQAASAVQVARLHSAPDTLEQAAAWLCEHVERGTARLSISPTTNLPLLRTSAAMGAASTAPTSVFEPWIDFQRTVPANVRDELGWSLVDLPIRTEAGRAAARADPRAFVRGLEADYLVLEVVDGGERPLMTAMRDAARADGRLVASFVPEGPEAGDPHGIEPYASAEYYPRDRFVWRILDASALGPHLEIYRFER